MSQESRDLDREQDIIETNLHSCSLAIAQSKENSTNEMEGELTYNFMYLIKHAPVLELSPEARLRMLDTFTNLVRSSGYEINTLDKNNSHSLQIRWSLNNNSVTTMPPQILTDDFDMHLIPAKFVNSKTSTESKKEIMKTDNTIPTISKLEIPEIVIDKNESEIDFQKYSMSWYYYYYWYKMQENQQQQQQQQQQVDQNAP